jgi:hypothetical protein
MIKRNIFIIFCFIAAISTLLIISPAKAQLTTGQDFFVEFTPEYPGANTFVSGRVGSYSFDINRAEIAWIVNNKVAAMGKNFSFTTGGLGSETRLDVSVITQSGSTFSKSFNFTAAEVDLLWEASSYTPVQYSGKALPSYQTIIKAVAIPQGMKTPDSNLVYEWKLNDRNLADSSGIGKNVLNFSSSENDENFVEITVSNSDKSITAKNKILIKTRGPQILFYEELPLEGPQYQKELGASLSLQKSELTIIAEPYFFSRNALQSISYEWLMNDKKIETSGKPNLLNLALPAAVKGASLIRFSMSNLLNITETAEKELQINFNPE